MSKIPHDIDLQNKIFQNIINKKKPKECLHCGIGNVPYYSNLCVKCEKRLPLHYKVEKIPDKKLDYTFNDNKPSFN